MDPTRDSQPDTDPVTECHDAELGAGRYTEAHDMDEMDDKFAQAPALWPLVPAAGSASQAVA